MTFLNFALLGGMLAGGIPLIIHLLHRSKIKTIRWGPMFLLKANPHQNHRRPKLEQLLLLLLRIALPIVLALCMARPVLTGMTGLQGTAPSSLVLLLDNSPSMGAQTNGRYSFLRACEEISQIIRDLPRGSEIAILPLDSPDHPILGTTTRLKSGSEILTDLTPSSAPARIAEGLEGAASLMAEMHHANRSVILLSDFQKSNWKESDSPEWHRALRRLRSLQTPPRLVLYDVGSGTSQNVSIETLDFSKSPLGIGQSTSLRATFRNYGSKPFPDLRVLWKVNGTVHHETVVPLESRSSAQSIFSHSFTEAGSHVVEVSIDADPITADNSFWASLTVRDRIPVLLVNGAPSTEPLQGETDFLEMALHPLKEGKSLIDPTIMDPSALNAKALSKAGVLVLANIRTLTALQVAEIEEFVRNGGGLLVFPGSKTDTKWYNENLFRNGEGLLPARLETLHKGDSQGRPASLAPVQANHPVLEPFGQSGLSLGDTSIRSWFSLRVAALSGSHTDPKTSTIANFENGEPLLIEGRFGSGPVILSSIPCSPEWTNLPTRPAFVPLMQRLVIHLAASIQPPKNLAPGDSLVAYFPPPPSKRDSSPSEIKAQVNRPDGSQIQSPAILRGDRLVVETTETRLNGKYSVSIPSGETHHYVVNASRLDSDPELLSAKQVEDIAASLDSKLVRSNPEYQALDRDNRFGTEIWRTVLTSVLAFAFLELWLVRRFLVRKGGTA